jgi:molybdate transport system permease protein
VTDTASLALWISAGATLLAVLAGLPLAWLLGRRQFPGKSPLQAVLLLPLVLPATLLGYCLVALGQQPWLIRVMGWVGLAPTLDWRMALLIAWIGAMAMFIRSAQAEFARVDRRLEQAARTLGRSEWSLFWWVTLPLAWRGVLAGACLAFCRAVGEFALTLLVARGGPATIATSAVGLLALACAGVLVVSASRLTRAVG